MQDLLCSTHPSGYSVSDNRWPSLRSLPLEWESPLERFIIIGSQPTRGIRTALTFAPAWRYPFQLPGLSELSNPVTFVLCAHWNRSFQNQATAPVQEAYLRSADVERKFVDLVEAASVSDIKAAWWPVDCALRAVSLVRSDAAVSRFGRDHVMLVANRGCIVATCAVRADFARPHESI